MRLQQLLETYSMHCGPGKLLEYVFGNRHPDLTGYIREHLNSLRVSVASGEIHKLAVVFFDGCDTALERFVVEFGFAKEGEPQFSQADLDRSLKDCLLKLQFSDAGLRPLPNDCRFELVAYSSNPDAAAQHWVQGGSDVELSQPSIVPIKSVDLGGGGFRAQLHLEACLEYRS
uniref:Mitotic spindle assembly checkpoint protein MAD2B n=1 Tax=Tetraselmis sp. GSL018 TaxID=582737 RepID=A0A061QU11_9CHLO